MDPIFDPERQFANLHQGRATSSIPPVKVGLSAELRAKAGPLKAKPLKSLPKPLFHKRHYAALAETFVIVDWGCELSGEPPRLADWIDAFAKVFAADNPAFDRARFKAYIESRLR